MPDVQGGARRAMVLKAMPRILGGAACLCVVTVACLLPAAANELGGNYAWQYQSAAERAVRASTLDMIQRQRAGGYSNTYTTNIYGDQVNCSNSATALGSSGTMGVTGYTSSPAVSNLPNIYARSSGNSVDTTGTSGAGSLSVPLNSGQTSTSSPSTAGVYDTNSSLAVQSLQASGGTSSQVVNNTQSNSNSPQTASVSGSTACVSPGSTR